ncbi:spinster family MFS transporter [Tundrisphaera lichenicola]|uniref:spinster family MFS transporter n=1 Tax=Tundrisphaera lichenicola TaxID=2029860 RepID=UPI003EBDE7CE
MVHETAVDDGTGLAGAGFEPPRWAMLTFVVLFAIHMLDYLDRNILTSLQPQIREDIPGLTNEKWGLLATIFLVSYSFFSPITGWLGDRYRRTWLLAAGIGVWSLATLGSGLARDYNHLVLARSLLGIGEATYGVIAPTILIDLFRRDQRSRLMSAFFLAMPLGAALGIMLGPIIANRYSWHTAFFIVGVPGLVAAFIVSFLPEPIRGATEAIDPERLKAHQAAGARREDYFDLMVNSSYTYAVFGMSAYTFAIGGMLVWVPPYLFNTRGFDQEKAAMALAGVTFAAAVIGMLIGGWLADKLAKKKPEALFLVPGVSMLSSIPFVIMALMSKNPPVIYASIFAAETLMFVNTGPCMAIIANVVQPNLRAAALAISYAAVHVLGDIWSPWLIGKAADMFGDPETMNSSIGRALKAIGATPTQVEGHPPENIVAGLLILIPALLLSGIVFLAGARHLPREMALMRAKLKAAPVKSAGGAGSTTH